MTETKKNYREIHRCRICANTSLVPLLDLGRQCLTGVFPKTITAQVPNGPLELVKCQDTDNAEACGLVQLKHSYEPSSLYGENYGYRSSLNKSMVVHLAAKVQRIIKMGILRQGDLVIDIGSNDGTLLHQYPLDSYELVGIDPSARNLKKHYPPNARLYPDFFSAHLVKTFGKGKKAKVITSISMFYDVEDPVDFMRQVYEVLDDQGVWVLEQSYLPSMLEQTSYDTICHEHVEYYSLKQILWMARRVGFNIVDLEFNMVNGGSFSIALSKATKVGNGIEAVLAHALAHEENMRLSTMAPYEAFVKKVISHRQRLKDAVGKLNKAKKKIIGYGASTKGNVILQYAGFSKDDISCIAEVNQDKFGAFTPGTQIPIVSEEQAKQSHPDVMLVLPWHFRENIISREQGYLKQGGSLLFPLPEIEFVSGH